MSISSQTKYLWRTIAAQNIDALQKKATEFNKLDDFLKYVQSRQDNHASNEGVKLLSIHSSKGLEFSVVFIVGLNEGILPHQKSIMENLIEEERRLCYVGITRAQHRLYLSYRLNQDKRALEPSRFLHEAFPGRSF